MRYILFFFTLVSLCCNEAAEKKGLHSKMVGNWFVLFHEETVMSEKQEKLYAAVEDSLELLKNLKLVSFSEKGAFKQLDSFVTEGRWGTKDEQVVYVNDGGKGFENFRTEFERYGDEVLELSENINVQGEKIKLTWHLLKIEEGPELELFETAKNKWRSVPTKEETDPELKERLAQMLQFYAAYFKLIAERSSYFIPARVPLPLRFYQHAIGIKPFDKESNFVKLFYSPAQAERAFYLIKDAINKSKFDFPEKNSYSEEYSLMLNIMAEQIRK